MRFTINELQRAYQKAYNSFFGGETDDKTATEEQHDFNAFKVTELKAMAKDRGLKGYTGLRKAELIKLLQQN